MTDKKGPPDPMRIPLSDLQLRALGALGSQKQQAERDLNTYVSAILEGAGVSGPDVQYQLDGTHLVVVAP